MPGSQVLVRIGFHGVLSPALSSDIRFKLPA